MLSFVMLTLPLVHAASRPSLSFGLRVPHANFTIDPPSIATHIPDNAHPYEIAHLFLEEHVLRNGTNYCIRNDSYTDQNSGISHVYVRQLVKGLELVDANINLNIRDNQVLSYGNSVCFKNGERWEAANNTIVPRCWSSAKPSRWDGLEPGNLL